MRVEQPVLIGGTAAAVGTAAVAVLLFFGRRRSLRRSALEPVAAPIDDPIGDELLDAPKRFRYSDSAVHSSGSGLTIIYAKRTASGLVAVLP
jgi:hypothetical protein